VSQAPRRDLSVPLLVGVQRGDGSLRDEYLVNVSTTGLCLHMQTPIAVGEEIRVAFRLPSDEVLIEAACKVVWTSHGGEPPSFVRFFETGVQMSEIADEDRKRICTFVEAQVDRP
jgi:Tfp pilus assembly protein PilZ